MSSAAIARDKPRDEYRLPLNVKPTHYDVTIRTDLEKLTFDGFVNIDLDILEETSQVVFNTAELELTDASIYSESLKTQQVQSSRTVDKKMERASVHFPTALPAGSKAQLQIGFQGKLTGSMQGYYKSEYESEGKKVFYTLTQFEATAARRAFPCWDEPLLKATFKINMISRADTVNLSNMPVASEEEYKSASGSGTTVSSLADWFSALTIKDQNASNKWKISRFETTPPMSSYIVAYANGNFAHLESSYTSPMSGKTRPLRVYTTPDLIHQAQFALDVKAQVLPIYETVFDVEYPLPKLDTLVVHDFDAGAMENWGLITGRTSAFLLDPKRADMAAKQRVVTVQSHEVAHMWFGNIVTMEWWDNLYLNEGFATVMGEVIIVDKIYPEWKVYASFITEHLNSALRLDAKLSSHPIEVDCPDANQINQIFDSLSYSKAGSCLRMLSDFVGEELFLKGVSIYLKKRLYGNSVTNDLWEGISEATGKDIPKIMHSWVSKIGFPVLTVTESKEGIQVRQDRFLETGRAEGEQNETIWSVPLGIVTVENGKASVDKSVLLDTRETTIALDTTKPFKLNAGTTGVYRVLYTPERLASIAQEAARGDDVFSLNDRIGLVHDAFALARAGCSEVSSALTLVDILKNEKEFLVWESVSDNLATLSTTWWENPRVTGALNKFQRALYGPLVEQLGYEYSDKDSAQTIQLRTRAITHAAMAEDPEVIKELQGRFAHYLKTGDNSKIPADLTRISFITAVKYGGREEFEFMKGICQKPPYPSAGTAAMAGLGANPDRKLIDETLEYIMTKARDQDVIYYYRSLATNPKARRIAAEFFKENYDVLYERFKSNTMLKYLVTIAFSSLSTKKEADDVAKFFEGKDTSLYNMGLAQTLETVYTKAAWLERSTDDLTEWLEKWEEKSKL